MADLAPGDQIEQIVGARRHRDQHLGRAVSAEQTAYILHSETCRDSGIDLRDCAYSKALDRGIDMDWWHQHQDRPVVLAPFHNRLIPLTPEWLADLVTPPVEPDCSGCGRRIAGDEAHWLDTDEWRESRLCVVCLWGPPPVTNPSAGSEVRDA